MDAGRTAPAQPPCQGSNLGRRATACPRMDKVESRLVQARLWPVGPRVDFTASPALARWDWETCRLCSRLQGVGRPVPARTWPCPELAAGITRVSSSRLPGGAPVPRGSTKRPCLPQHRDSGIAAGCEIVDVPKHGHTPARARASDPRESVLLWSQRLTVNHWAGRSWLSALWVGSWGSIGDRFTAHSAATTPLSSSSSQTRAGCQAKTEALPHRYTWRMLSCSHRTLRPTTGL
jgi:hypothetical protein